MGDVATTIAVVGKQSSGKTSLITKYGAVETARGVFEAKIGGSSRTTFIREYSITSEDADVSGIIQPVVVLVFSVVSAASFKIIEAVCRIPPENRQLLVFVGTHIDLDSQREVHFEQGHSLASSQASPYIECSCTSGYHIQDVFSTIQQRLHESGPRAAPRVVIAPSEVVPFQPIIAEVIARVRSAASTHRDLFINMLVGNASDALDRVQFQSLSNKAILDTNPNLEIFIAAQKSTQTLTVFDSGIGMSGSDLIEKLSSPKAAARSFLDAMDSGADLTLIGEYGLGFWTVFTVAQRVVITSKSNDDPQQYMWISDGTRGYSVRPDVDGPRIGRGTQIVLYLKDEFTDLLEPKRLKEVVRKHCSKFTTYAIKLPLDLKTPVIPSRFPSAAVNARVSGAESAEVQPNARRLTNAPFVLPPLADVHRYAMAPSKRDSFAFMIWPTATARSQKALQSLSDIFMSQLNLTHDELTVLAQETFSECTVTHPPNAITAGKPVLLRTTLQKFLLMARAHYRDVPYHNWEHAFAVLRTSYALMFGFPDVASKFTVTERLAVLLAAVIHDVDHPGYGNSLIINSHGPLAARYNDTSPLENHHLALGWVMMEECGIFDFVDDTDRVRIRKLCIAMVLATDMSRHKNTLSHLDELLSVPANWESVEFRTTMLVAILKVRTTIHSIFS
eukprot:TRINITY_DN475_c0_g3_i1.p1 TRINITY_DN475_c0_g3~~TRINITY_DN475_c0_g3_i1.p1  ORF type:complete len:675 (-),score=113.74 TRINITY_DN475_c0_g3_i1:501-2525(-)